jgi:monolysocardiolipin acyltransferase
MWGVLPLRYLFNPDNMRWGMASYDLCFTNKPLSTFFTLGQLLPTHRAMYSQHGGLFQPTVTQAIRLLSHGPFLASTFDGTPNKKPNRSLRSPDLSDPFTGGHLTFTTNGEDTFPVPSAYRTRRHAWVHIFPEGRIHQHEEKVMRYFKWGVSRLILESEPCPDLVPIWIEGPDQVMNEERGFPKPLPRPFKEVSVTFGKKLDGEKAFGDLRARWKRMVERDGSEDLPVGVLSERLKHDPEAVKLREECTMRVRRAVLDVRRGRGLPDEDPKQGLAETYALEGRPGEGKKDDGSVVRSE